MTSRGNDIMGLRRLRKRAREIYKRARPFLFIRTTLLLLLSHTFHSTMSNQLTRVIYKPSTQSSEEYIIMIDAAEVSGEMMFRHYVKRYFQYKKWKEGGMFYPFPSKLLLN